MKQDFPSDRYEIILVWDATEIAIEKFCRQHAIKTLIEPSPSIGAKMIRGIIESKGEIVCFLNDDDLFFPSKLKTVFEEFNKDSEIVYVHNNSIRINAEGKIISDQVSNISENILITKGNINRRFLKEAHSRYLFFNDSSISIRKERFILFKDYISRIEGAQDNIFFYIAAMEGGKLLFLNQSLTYFRLHNAGTSYKNNIDNYVNLMKRRFRSFLLLSDFFFDKYKTQDLSDAIYSDMKSTYFQLKLLCINSYLSDIDEKPITKNKEKNTFIMTRGRLILVLLFLISKLNKSFAKRAFLFAINKF
ncbi:MAG: glycosyltransferase [Candidatus Thermoplasmatota archaeon]|nr:glycosyltransferase [Candidatus Thermoplasmatota archaeon]